MTPVLEASLEPVPPKKAFFATLWCQAGAKVAGIVAMEVTLTRKFTTDWQVQPTYSICHAFIPQQVQKLLWEEILYLLWDSLTEDTSPLQKT